MRRQSDWRCSPFCWQSPPSNCACSDDGCITSRPMAEIAQQQATQPSRLLADSPEAQARYDRLSGLSRLIVYGLLILGAVAMILPFVWMVSSACKPGAEINTIPVYFIPQNV